MWHWLGCQRFDKNPLFLRSVKANPTATLRMFLQGLLQASYLHRPLPYSCGRGRSLLLRSALRRHQCSPITHPVFCAASRGAKRLRRAVHMISRGRGQEFKTPASVKGLRGVGKLLNFCSKELRVSSLARTTHVFEALVTFGLCNLGRRLSLSHGWSSTGAAAGSETAGLAECFDSLLALLRPSCLQHSRLLSFLDQSLGLLPQASLRRSAPQHSKTPLEDVLSP